VWDPGPTSALYSVPWNSPIRLILKAPLKTPHDAFHSVAHGGSRWRLVRTERSPNGLEDVGALPVSFRDEERGISLGRGCVFLPDGSGGGARARGGRSSLRVVLSLSRTGRHVCCRISWVPNAFAGVPSTGTTRGHRLLTSWYQLLSVEWCSTDQLESVSIVLVQ
jgi:hypothetical protein